MDFDGVKVALVPWPGASAHADAASRAGSRPRLFLVAAESAPPALEDESEDWVRVPADDRDIEVRARRLARIVRERTPVMAGDAAHG